jgi:hypothetical protein
MLRLALAWLAGCDPHSAGDCRDDGAGVRLAHARQPVPVLPECDRQVQDRYLRGGSLRAAGEGPGRVPVEVCLLAGALDAYPGEIGAAQPGAVLDQQLDSGPDMRVVSFVQFRSWAVRGVGSVMLFLRGSCGKVARVPVSCGFGRAGSGAWPRIRRLRRPASGSSAGTSLRARGIPAGA